jgi:hypothetical protein
MINALARSLRRPMAAILVAWVIGSAVRIASAQSQSQPAETVAAGRWVAFGGGPEGMVGALGVFDEPGSHGSHAVLYAGGRFTRAGGRAAKHIAKWDEERWLPVGEGIEGESVEALTVFDDDGAGPRPPVLYVAGAFNTAGGKKVSNIARWNGMEWSAVGDGIDGMVLALAVYDEDQEGPRPPSLFAAGMFGHKAASSIARWDGHEWSAVGERRSAEVVYSLAVADPDGDGPAKPGLVVGGARSVDLWNGHRWYSFGEPGFRTFALATCDHDGTGRPTLYAAGQIIDARRGASTTIARWDGEAWTPLPEALDERVYALTVFDPDGTGPATPELYVAGSFTKVGDRAAHGLASWNGRRWSVREGGPRSRPLSPRMNCLAVFDPDAAGPEPALLCVGGLFKLGAEKAAGNVAAWSLSPSPLVGP